MILSFVLTGSFFTVLALLTEQGKPLGAGVVTALTGAGLLAGSTFAPWTAQRLSPLPAIAAQAMVWAVALGLLVAWPTLGSAAVAMALMWLLVPTTRVAVETWVADHISTGKRGRVQSLRQVVNSTASPFGPVASGVLIAVFDFRATLAILAMCAALAVLLTVSKHFSAWRPS